MADLETLGSALYAQWVIAGGTTLLHAESRQFTYTPSIDYAERQAGSDATKKRVPLFKDFNWSLEYTAQSDGTALITAFAEGQQGTLTVGEFGTAVGKPKLTLPSRSAGIVRNVPYNDIVMWTISGVADGDPTYGTW